LGRFKWRSLYRPCTNFKIRTSADKTAAEIVNVCHSEARLSPRNLSFSCVSSEERFLASPLQARLAENDSMATSQCRAALMIK
jgi:hypothetical protein